MSRKTSRISLSKVLKEEMIHPAFRFYFNQEQAVTNIARMIKQARIRSGLTQTELAARAQTTQSVIARIESGSDSRTPSLDLLQRIASALRARLLISFEYGAAA